MKTLLLISFRNLFRQKRRNMLLGSAIAVCVMILVGANALSSGVSDTLFNRIISYVAGHVGVTVNEGTESERHLFRDGRLLNSIVESSVTGLLDYNENISVYVRAIGNGRADNMVLAGIDTVKKVDASLMRSYEESFRLIEGKYEDINRTDIENPVLISKEKASVLNVKINDIIKTRYRNLHGQYQTARLTVVGILSNDNVFMQGVALAEMGCIRKMMGYENGESASLYLMVRNPQENALHVAEQLFKALRSESEKKAIICGTIVAADVIAVPYLSDIDQYPFQSFFQSTILTLIRQYQRIGYQLR